MTWWRSQRTAILALVASAVAVIGVHAWLDAIPATRTEPPVVVAQDGRAEISGQELDLAGARWDEFEAPEGSRTLSVRIDAVPTPDAQGCGTLTLTEAHGARVWVNARTVLDVPFDAGESSCLEESGPYRIVAVFLLPDDAEGPFLLDVPGADGIARFDIAF